MHVLPRVGELHERFEDVLTVIGVHSGKFVAERRTERIAAACERLEVHHPVVNDRQFRTWRDYAVSAWPTIALVDPEGYLVGVQPGELDVEAVADVIRRIAEDAEERGTLVRGAGAAGAGAGAGGAGAGRSGGALAFPSRAIVAGDRLWVSDMGHHRVLECAWDGAAAAATVLDEHGGFAEPRGLAVDGDAVYVADRRAHSVWRIAPGEQVRVGGTGELGAYRIDEGDADVPLRSPWGLATHDGRLLLTMAGSHQLWWLDPAASRLTLSAGTGAEEIADGVAERALLAQPTGAAFFGSATTAGLAAVFADCESSGVRVLDGGGQVSTLIGTGLFKFGDRDGIGDDALLQHCEDVAVFGGRVAVADTYNDRLKSVNPSTRECGPWPGEAGEEGAFFEPAGVSATPEGLLVADTNNHRLVLVAPDVAMREITLA